MNWKTEDATDLDYTPLPLIVRNNNEESFQFTQEVRVASAPNALDSSVGRAVAEVAGRRVPLHAELRAGRGQHVRAVRVLAVHHLPVGAHARRMRSSTTSASASTDRARRRLANRVDLTAGVRVDNEQKDASLSTFFTPPIAPPDLVDADESFSNVSPQFSAAVRIQPEKTAYVSVTRGYKAGGFNPASPVGSEAYGEEHAWNLEGGVKTMWAAGRVMANASVFRIDWEDLQLNLPDLTVAGAVLHRQHRRRDEHRRRARAQRARASERGCVRRRRLHASPVLGRRQRVERRAGWRKHDPEHAGVHGDARRAGLASAAARHLASTGGPRRCSTARSSTTT